MKDDVTLKFEDVANGVEEALRRQFGSSAEIERVRDEDDGAYFGFVVDGYPYSLVVTATP